MDDEAEKMVDLVDKVIALFQRNEAAIATGVGPMQCAQVAFMACSLNQVTTMDDTTIYTALPVPKYDEEQKEYRTVNTNGFDVWLFRRPSSATRSNPVPIRLPAR